MRHSWRKARLHLSLASSLAAALLALGLLFAGPASASYEQVKTFATSGTGHDYAINAQAVAVNETGAGGVAPGTVYVVNRCGAECRPSTPGVGLYSSKGEFLGAWGNFGALGIAIDQATGNVYIEQYNTQAGHNVIEVFSPDGSKVLASFGQLGAFRETALESPEKIHGAYQHSIEVDDSGNVYFADVDSGTSGRIMVFKPQSPGDYEHYEYAGRASDIAEGRTGAGGISVDSAGNLYIGLEDGIFEFAPGEPDVPRCEFSLPTNGLESVVAGTGVDEVFYYSYKNKKIHQLVCNGEDKFIEKSAITLSPRPTETVSLALNRSLEYEAGRPKGTLYAVNADNFESANTIGYIAAPAAIRPPSVLSQSVSSVTSTTAVLNAQVNPNSFNTSYVFQYLTEAQYEANEPTERFAGASEAPLGGAVLGGGNVALGASAALTALAPGTAYRYRVVATSHCDPDDEAKACETPGSAAIFSTFPAEAPGLPDGRVYELVSPTLKQVAEVAPLAPESGSCGTECKPGGGRGNPVVSSPDGEAIAYRAGPFSNSGATGANEYLARRTASGWQSVGLSMPRQGPDGFQAFDTMLTRGITLQNSGATLNPEAPEGYENLYEAVTDSPTSPPTPLVASSPPNRAPGLFKPKYAGASTDLSRVFFAANDALTEATAVAPAAIDGGEENDNLYERSGGVTSLVNVLPGNAGTVPGAAFGFGPRTISSDGSRAFWSGLEGKAYVRVNGVETEEIPGAGNCHLNHAVNTISITGACFLTASSDGSKALLLSGELFSLTPDGHYQLEADLTDGKGGFLGIAGQSDDLSSIYFVDTAVLGEEENGEGDVAQAGKPNLYSWSAGDTKFVGTITGTNFGPGGSFIYTDWELRPSHRAAEASPGGRYLAFVSNAPLTHQDNVGPCIGGDKGPCAEVFLFDSQSGSLRCASCSPTAAPPLGSSTLPRIEPSEFTNGFAQPSYLTDQGRLYFDSRDSLSPFDTNQGVEDVYELEPEGVGDCSRAGGCLRLISGGREPVDSNFAAIDKTGKNVFFTTRDKLALKDHDEFYDLYDAREEGGIGAETETARGECQGEACQPQVSAPNDPTPGSSSFEGAGNVNEAKAKAKKHGKKQKKHSKKHKKPKSQKRAAHKRAAGHHRGGAK